MHHGHEWDGATGRVWDRQRATMQETEMDNGPITSRLQSVRTNGGSRNKSRQRHGLMKWDDGWRGKWSYKNEEMLKLQQETNRRLQPSHVWGCFDRRFVADVSEELAASTFRAQGRRQALPKCRLTNYQSRRRHVLKQTHTTQITTKVCRAFVFLTF